jgi:hypothetical protein
MADVIPMPLVDENSWDGHILLLMKEHTEAMIARGEWERPTPQRPLRFPPRCGQLELPLESREEVWRI